MTQIFAWRALERLSYQHVADRLNTDLDRYPPPVPVKRESYNIAIGAWTSTAVRDILNNPKYTGYMVWNRRKRSRPDRGVKGRVNPPSEWVWSPSVTHEPLTTRAYFDAGSPVGRYRQGSRSKASTNAHPTPRPSAATDTGPTSSATWWAGGPARPTHLLLTVVAVAVAAAAIGAVASPTSALPAFWLFAVVGTGLAIVDVRCRRLPHRLTGVLWASSGLFFIVEILTGSDVGPLIRAASAGVGTATVMLAVALVLPGQLGLGDVVFAGAVAFNLGWLGWQTAVLGLVAGLLLQGAIALVVKIRRAADAIDTPTPMGPALAAGWLLAFVLAA